MDRDATATAEGRYGAFEGLRDDRVVFAHYREHGDWSPALLDLVCEQLRPRTVIDVGANIGLFSIPVAQRTHAVCHAFEPEPANHALLSRNVARHGLGGRVHVEHVAVYDAPGELSLRLSADNAGDHHVTTAAEDDGTLTVVANTLDRLLGGIELVAPVLLKIDTQGSELRVLRGAQAVLPQVDHCIVEYWPRGLGRVGDRPAQLRAALDGFPHAALLDQDDSRPHMETTPGLWQRLEFLTDDDPGFFDLLLSRDA